MNRNVGIIVFFCMFFYSSTAVSWPTLMCVRGPNRVHEDIALHVLDDPAIAPYLTVFNLSREEIAGTAEKEPQCFLDDHPGWGELTGQVFLDYEITNENIGIILHSTGDHGVASCHSPANRVLCSDITETHVEAAGEVTGVPSLTSYYSGTFEEKVEQFYNEQIALTTSFKEWWESTWYCPACNSDYFAREGMDKAQKLCHATLLYYFETHCEGGINNCNACGPLPLEVCNGIDDDCDGLTDEELTSLFYRDWDNDSFGDPDFSTTACELPEGYSTNSDDCVDSEITIFPGAEEVCNGVDDNCNNLIDEGVFLIFYQDLDQDGYGNSEITTESCAVLPGFSAADGDCQDNAGEIYPGAEEVCNGVDDNCDDQIDNGALCADSEICFQGICQFRCTGDTDCEEGLICDNQLELCIDPCAGIICEAGFECGAGICEEIPCYLIQCTEGTICLEGECIPLEVEQPEVEYAEDEPDVTEFSEEIFDDTNPDESYEDTAEDNGEDNDEDILADLVEISEDISETIADTDDTYDLDDADNTDDLVETVEDSFELNDDTAQEADSLEDEQEVEPDSVPDTQDFSDEGRIESNPVELETATGAGQDDCSCRMQRTPGRRLSLIIILFVFSGFIWSRRLSRKEHC